MTVYFSAYVDDLVIASETLEDHLLPLDGLFKMLKANSLTIN